MVAGKIKISIDNLDDAQGIVSNEENESEVIEKSEHSTKITVVSDEVEDQKEPKKTEEIIKPRKRGRPPKKTKVTESVKSVKKPKKEKEVQKDEIVDELEDKNEYINGFINKINVSAAQKEEVMEEIEKKHSHDEKQEEKELEMLDKKDEKGNIEKQTVVEEKKEELKFSSLSSNEENLSEDKPEVAMANNLGVDEVQGGVRSVGLYRKIAVFFLIATIALLVFVFYFLFASVTVTIIPDQERINNNMIIDVYDSDINDYIEGEKIAGIVKKNSMDLLGVYQTTGEDVVGEQVTGEVTIYNYYNRNQPLVATTRIMSPDGRIYRLSETVNVPVNGEVKVAVYAEDPNVNMEIGPTKFTIPGLWAGIQDKIYAESFSKIEYSQRVNKFVTQSDIDNAIRDLKQKLVQKAKLEINKKYESYAQVIYSIDENTVFTQVDAKREDKVDEFEATITADIVAVAFDGQAAANLAEKKFMSTLPEEKELIEFNKNNIIYSLDSFDYNKGLASVNATFEGKVSLDASSDIIVKENILGLNKEQLDAYLINREGISGYNIEFFPSFIKRVPDIPDKIIIKTKL